MRIPSKRVWQILGLVCGWWVSPGTTSADGPGGGTGRQPELRTAGHDPANVLYLYARLYGGTVSYERVTSVLPLPGERVTLPEMRDAAARLELSTEVVRWTPAQALKAERPVISLLDALPPQEPGYVLLIGPSRDGRVWYIDGATATVRAMSEDEFRRRWSGLVLAPAARGKGWGWSRALAAGGGLGCAYWVLLRWRRRSGSHPTSSQA